MNKSDQARPRPELGDKMKWRDEALPPTYDDACAPPPPQPPPYPGHSEPPSHLLVSRRYYLLLLRTLLILIHSRAVNEHFTVPGEGR